jgi:aerobic carbon-monoxide dehydrogenase large subunit
MVDPTASLTAGRFVGQKVLRKEDPRLLTGHGRYVDDVQLPRMFARGVRVQRRRARASRVSTSRRRATLTVSLRCSPEPT